MYGVYCMDYQYPVVQVSKRIVATLKSFALCFLDKTGAYMLVL